MKINVNVNKSSIRILLNNIILSSYLRIDSYENGMPFCFEVSVFKNKDTLELLLDKPSYENIKEWNKVDIAILLWDIMERFNMDIVFDQEKGKFLIEDKEKES